MEMEPLGFVIGYQGRLGLFNWDSDSWGNPGEKSRLIVGILH